MISLGLAHTHIHSTKEESIYISDSRSTYFGRIVRRISCECGWSEDKPDGGFSKVSDEAIKLMNEVAIECGQPLIFPVFGPDGRFVAQYGSGWFCELGAVISYIIESEGQQAAIKKMHQAFDANDSSVVTRPVLGY